ncbi:hypothetical protein Tco_0058360 [Tanacetum coccineum]
MESVFSISNCTTASQVKFATCTLQDDALTWWNAHVKSTTTEAAHAMPWADTEENDDQINTARRGVRSRRFETEIMVFPEEKDKIEKNNGGLPDMIHGRCKRASIRKLCKRLIEFTTEADGRKDAPNKYIGKRIPIFLAHVTAKEGLKTSREEALEDVPIVQELPEVFPED